MKTWHQADAKPVTVEFDASLARQLANDEPKCGNCKHWTADDRAESWGLCGRLTAAFSAHPSYASLVGPAKELSDALGMAFGATTDLSVCSAWAGK
jgi:hypothetical protein